MGTRKLDITHGKNKSINFTASALKQETARIDAVGITQVKIRDTGEAGLILRKQSRDWIVVFEKKIRGKVYRLTIETYDPVTFSVARVRAEAKRLHVSIREGSYVPNVVTRQKLTEIDTLRAMTIADVIDLHSERNRATRQTTLNTYRRQLNAAFGLQRHFAAIDRDAVSTWYTTAIADGKSPAGLKSTHASGKALWNTWAVEFEDVDIGKNPFVEFAGRKGKNLAPSTARETAIPRHLTGTFIKHAMICMREEGASNAAPACLALMALTGMRLGTATGLRWDEVHPRRITVTADRMKAGRALTLPITKVTKEILDHQRDIWGDSEFVFPASTASGHVANMRKMLMGICNAVGAPNVTNHDLRRTYAAAANFAGVPKIAVQMLLGHAAKDVSDEYAQAIRPELPKYSDMIEEELTTDSALLETSETNWWEA